MALLFILICPSRDPKKLRRIVSHSSRILTQLWKLACQASSSMLEDTRRRVSWIKLPRSNEDGFVDRTSYSGQLLQRLGTKRSHVDSASFSAGYRRNSSGERAIQNEISWKNKAFPRILFIRSFQVFKGDSVRCNNLPFFRNFS